MDKILKIVIFAAHNAFSTEFLAAQKNRYIDAEYILNKHRYNKYVSARGMQSLKISVREWKKNSTGFE